MGSLMAGWGSQVHDPRIVKFERNKSLTKEEIESYWRSKKKAEEEHLRDISHILMKTTTQESTLEEPETERKLERSSSLPLRNTKQGLPEVETETSLEKLLKKNGWWTRSNSAFLNEPPVIQSEGPTYRYASQFHVAGIGSSNSHPQTGISA